MRLRTGIILALLATILSIDYLTRLDDWWLAGKIYIIWGVIFYDAFADSMSGIKKKGLLILAIISVISSVQYLIFNYAL